VVNMPTAPHAAFTNSMLLAQESGFNHVSPVQDDVAIWGHEYIRSLSGEIGEEYHARREKDDSVEDLLGLVAQIVPFHMTHNAGKPLLEPS